MLQTNDTVRNLSAMNPEKSYWEATLHYHKSTPLVKRTGTHRRTKVVP